MQHWQTDIQQNSVKPLISQDAMKHFHTMSEHINLMKMVQA